MSIPDGGPAFPRTAHATMSYEDIGEDAHPQAGMSLRDYFAAHALAGLLAGLAYDEGDTSHVAADARVAYEYADAMTAARKPKETP